MLLKKISAAIASFISYRMFDVTLDMKTRHFSANLLKQMGEVSTSIINLKLTENLINAFPLFHDSVRTSESRFINHMLKRNPITDKFFWTSYRIFVSWLCNRCHFVEMVMEVIPISHSCTLSKKKTTQFWKREGRKIKKNNR